MSELTTNKVFEKLSKAAMDKESSRQWSILTKCYSDLGLDSSGFKLGIENPDDKNAPRYFVGVYELFALIISVLRRLQYFNTFSNQLLNGFVYGIIRVYSLQPTRF